ncbi:hypothetical protein MHYP_G00310150 [Metynnis hypsauchen]
MMTTLTLLLTTLTFFPQAQQKKNCVHISGKFRKCDRGLKLCNAQLTATCDICKDSKTAYVKSKQIFQSGR